MNSNVYRFHYQTYEGDPRFVQVTLIMRTPEEYEKVMFRRVVKNKPRAIRKAEESLVNQEKRRLKKESNLWDSPTFTIEDYDD